jgi:hypothetical protein
MFWILKMPKVLCWVVGSWGLVIGRVFMKRRLGGFSKVVTLRVGVIMVFVHEREVGRFSES